MKLSDFNYKLPQELIAQHPLGQRDKSRMLVLNKDSGDIQHRHFYNLPKYVNNDDAVVLNDTKVFKARLIGKRAGFSGKIELLILNKKKDHVFECLTKPSRKLKPGTMLEFAQGSVKAEVIEKKQETSFIKFNNGSILDFEKIGQMPLPPYIKRQPQYDDEIKYQTIYAKNTGAVAAPTAGLHFTDSVLADIKQKNTNIIYITLHVGFGTFKPVDVDDIKQHKMHSEYFDISKNAASKINETRQQGGKVLAVGTTTCRALESSVFDNSSRFTVHDSRSNTDLFITPGYNFKVTDMLLTNFHLPCTTLLMLACAFGGYEKIMNAYKEAVKERYRFYSYGDCMLIV